MTHRTWRHAAYLTAIVSTAALVAACVVDEDATTEKGPSPVGSTRAALAAGGRDAFFKSLNETVTFVGRKNANGSTSKYIVRADGRVQSYGQLMRDDDAAHFARIGAMEEAFADYVAAAAPDARIPASIHFAAPEETPELRARLRSEDDAVRAAAITELAQSIAAAGHELREALDVPDVRNVRAVSTMPVFFVEATPARLTALARFPGVTGVNSNIPGRGAKDYTAPNTMTMSGIDAQNTASPPRVGANRKLGLIDNPKVVVWDAHEAFGNSTLTLKGNPDTCDAITPCPAVTGSVEHNAVCEVMRDGKSQLCIGLHETRTASAAVATRGLDEWGAAEASLFQYLKPDASCSVPGAPYDTDYSNACHDPAYLTCTPSAMADAYAWFGTQNVSTIFESWGCEVGGPVTNDGLAEDYAARHTGTTVVKSSGNNTVAWGCMASNALCVGGMTDGGTVGVGATVNIDAGTNIDREDPDVVALSNGAVVADVDLASPASTNYWFNHNGTSFAAPTMAALVTLMKNGSGSCSPIMDSILTRAIMMNATWYYDAGAVDSVDAGGLGFPQMDGSGTVDYHAGTGGPFAKHVLWYCGVGTPAVNIGSTTRTADLDAKLPAATTGMGEGLGTSWAYEVVASPVLTGSDSRVRVTVTWNACTGGAHTPTKIESDLDLWICNPAATMCWSSRSNSNNWEALDVQGLAAGTYSIRVGHDTASPGCGIRTEPYSVAWAYAATSSFTKFPGTP